MKRRQKVYVLRGGALLSQKKAWLHFGENGDTIVIPMAVINKLYYFSKVKKTYAQDFCDFISTLNLSKLMEDGATLENGVTLRVMTAKSIPPVVHDSLKVSSTDDSSVPETLAICLDLIYDRINASDMAREDIASQSARDFYSLDSDDFSRIKHYSAFKKAAKDVILVSQNIPLLLRASDLGINSQYVPDMIFPTPNDRYTGKTYLNVPNYVIESLKNNGTFQINSIIFEEDKPLFKTLNSLHENQYVLLNNYYPARYSKKALYSLKVDKIKEFTPANFEQHCAMDALLLPPSEAPLVIIDGVAGTGKTFVAIQSALSQLDSVYEKILIATPAVGGHVSSDEAEKYGFLPGDILEKLSPMLGGIIDNIVNHISDDRKELNGYSPSRAREEAERSTSSYFENGLIDVQPLAYIAGHSLKNTFILIDEAQNIQPSYFLDLITRVGRNTKIAILGDPDQVKVSSLSRRVNGIIYMMETWKDDDLAFEIQMDPNSSVRSELCQRAIDLLS